MPRKEKNKKLIKKSQSYLARLSYPRHDSGTILEQAHRSASMKYSCRPPTSQPANRETGWSHGGKQEGEIEGEGERQAYEKGGRGGGEETGKEAAGGHDWFRTFAFFPTFLSTRTESAIKACQLQSQK